MPGGQKQPKFQDTKTHQSSQKAIDLKLNSSEKMKEVSLQHSNFFSWKRDKPLDGLTDQTYSEYVGPNVLVFVESSQNDVFFFSHMSYMYIHSKNSPDTCRRNTKYNCQKNRSTQHVTHPNGGRTGCYLCGALSFSCSNRLVVSRSNCCT